MLFTILQQGQKQIDKQMPQFYTVFDSKNFLAQRGFRLPRMTLERMSFIYSIWAPRLADEHIV